MCVHCVLFLHNNYHTSPQTTLISYQQNKCINLICIYVNKTMVNIYTHENNIFNIARPSDFMHKHYA